MLSESKLIFIISLPRSGSTLLQRILASQRGFESCAETWMLLPPFYSTVRNSTFSEYGHTSAANAINDLIELLPGGKATYNSEIKKFYLGVVGAAMKNLDGYFIEKTPRNALIASELLTTFPSAKFIFLWRHPASIVASIIDTWGKGSWNIYKYRIDLIEGMRRMVEAFQDHSSNILSLKYEDLVQDPSAAMGLLSNHIGIDLCPAALEEFSQVKFSGRMGDPVGVHRYSSIDKSTLEKWRQTINTPLRQWWIKNYMEWLEDAQLNVQHYQYENDEPWFRCAVRRPVTSVKDFGLFFWGMFATAFEANQFGLYFKMETRRNILIRHN